MLVLFFYFKSNVLELYDVCTVCAVYIPSDQSYQLSCQFDWERHCSMKLFHSIDSFSEENVENMDEIQNFLIFLFHDKTTK